MHGPGLGRPLAPRAALCSVRPSAARAALRAPLPSRAPSRSRRAPQRSPLALPHEAGGSAGLLLCGTRPRHSRREEVSGAGPAAGGRERGGGTAAVTGARRGARRRTCFVQLWERGRRGRGAGRPPPTHAASRRAARARPEAARRGAAAAHPRLPPRGAAAARKRPPGAASADVRATRPAEPLSSPLSYLTLAAVVSDGLSKERHGYPGRDGAGPSGGGREEGVTGLQRAALCLGTARAVGGQRLGPARGYGLLCSHVEFFVTVVVSALGTVNVAQMQLEGTRGVRCVLGTGCQCPAILLGSGAIDDALLVPGQPEVLTLWGWALRGTWHEGAAFSAQGREAFKALVASGLHRPASLIARGCQTCVLTSLVLASLVWKYPHVEGRAVGALSQAHQTHRVQHTEVPSLFKVTSPDDPYVFINIYIF